MLAPGAIIAGRYRVATLLGKGGMGEVYRADDLTLNQPVAMKFLPRKLASDPAALARFHSEVRVARNVAHPSVCRVFDIGESEGRIFLTMEYIDGEDLALLLRRIGRLPSDKAVELARQICAGVAAAHEAGILHRDLKPANIMVDGRGRAHVTDFGVAGLAEDLKYDLSRAGTLAYMAPEQLAGKGVSVQSDIFSLGLILYEMFTGKRAFDAPSVAELMRAHEGTSPSRPSSMIADMDPLAERIILKCLERDPVMRPRTALAVAYALPGGDPLAAALAAGETPSPEMVAASGGEGSLPAGKAWALLTGTLLAIAAILALSPWSTNLGLAPLEDSPDVMTRRARDLARKFGYKDSPKDSAYWYETNSSFLRQRGKTLPASQEIGDLKSAPQGHSKFYYRQSPRDMVVLTPSMGVDNNTPEMLVERDTPPQLLSGMVMVALEPDGSLDEFIAVPPQEEAAREKPSPPDWNALFAESGLDPKRFEQEEPVWISPVAFDARTGWKGSYAQDPATIIHVSAAAYHGRPVYFRVIAPWDHPDRDTSSAAPRRVAFGQILLTLITVVLVAIGFFMVWRNLTQGRGDQKAALRLARFQMVASMLFWLFVSHHQTAPGAEWSLFTLGVALSSWSAGLAWCLYLAIEPHVRGTWPEVITSWTRLIGGGWRDPLVGRHVLIGSLAAALFVLVRSLLNAVPVWLNARNQVPGSFWPAAIVSLPGATGLVMSVAATRVINDLGVTFLLFLLRVIARRRWLAEVIGITIGALVLYHPGHMAWEVLFAIIWGAALMLLCTRVGLVALLTFDGCQIILQKFPLTFHPSHWYFSQSLLGLLVCIGLAVYGFYTSLGGKPVFGGGRSILSFSDQ